MLPLVKRSPMPNRRKPMNRGGGLKRTRMRSKPKRNPMPVGRHDEIIRRDRQCQAPLHGAPGRCWGRLEIHHKRNRGMGGSLDPAIHDAENLLALCSFHNGWVEDNPRHARELGLKC